MNGDLLTLQTALADFGKQLAPRSLDHTKQKITPYGMVWLLMVGSCYSLTKAKFFLSAQRNAEIQLQEAAKLLENLATQDDESINESSLSSWIVGYYLFSSEQRVAAALHRLLKTYCDRPDHIYAPTLIRDDLLNRCPHCQNSPTNSYPTTERILQNFLNELDSFKRREDNRAQRYTTDKSSGVILARVWDRVNFIKHDPQEPTNPEDPHFRWEDSLGALSAILNIFKELAKHSNIIS